MSPRCMTDGIFRPGQGTGQQGERLLLVARKYTLRVEHQGSHQIAQGAQIQVKVLPF